MHGEEPPAASGGLPPALTVTATDRTAGFLSARRAAKAERAFYSDGSAGAGAAPPGSTRPTSAALQCALSAAARHVETRRAVSNALEHFEALVSVLAPQWDARARAAEGEGDAARARACAPTGGRGAAAQESAEAVTRLRAVSLSASSVESLYVSLAAVREECSSLCARAKADARAAVALPQPESVTAEPAAAALRRNVKQATTEYARACAQRLAAACAAAQTHACGAAARAASSLRASVVGQREAAAALAALYVAAVAAGRAAVGAIAPGSERGAATAAAAAAARTQLRALLREAVEADAAIAEVFGAGNEAEDSGVRESRERDMARRRRATAVEVSWRELVRELEAVDGGAEDGSAEGGARAASRSVYGAPAGMDGADAERELKSAARSLGVAAAETRRSLEAAADALEELARTTGGIARARGVQPSGWSAAADGAVHPLIDSLLAAAKSAATSQSAQPRKQTADLPKEAKPSPSAAKQPSMRMRFSSWVRGEGGMW